MGARGAMDSANGLHIYAYKYTYKLAENIYNLTISRGTVTSLDSGDGSELMAN